MNAASRQSDGEKPKRKQSAAQLANLKGGSRKGVPNKNTAAMKEAIMHVYAALQDKTGKEHGHFVDWAEANPTDFYKLAAKLIPVQLDHSGGIQIIAASPIDERI